MLEWNDECFYECCDEWMSARINRWMNEEEWKSGYWIPES